MTYNISDLVLVIPRFKDIREQLFRLAHDSLGHFGFEKSYGSLKDVYYWPNMRRIWKMLTYPLVKAVSATKAARINRLDLSTPCPFLMLDLTGWK